MPSQESPPYHLSHGGKPPADRSDIDFSASLNPLGAPDFVLEAYGAAAGDLGQYPDPEQSRLREQAASRLGLSPDQLVFAGGGDELLLRAIPALVRHGLLLVEPSYGSYRQAGENADLEIASYRPGPENGFSIDFAALRQAVSALAPGSGLVVGTPNNPSGVLADPEALAKLVMDFPQIVFIVDEAFIDFYDPDSQPSLLGRLSAIPENLTVIRSLTKIYAIPGLRLGYAVGTRPTIRKLRAHLQSWPLSCAAEKVGQAIFSRDDSFVRQSRELIQAERQRVSEALSALPEIQVFPGAANFLLLRVSQAASSLTALKFLGQREIIVRDCSNFPGLDAGYLRVAIRNPQANDQLIAAFTAWANGEPNGAKVVENAGDAESAGGTTSAGDPRPGSRSGTRHGRATAAKTPALMIQGCSSSTGKSLLAAAFCRIFKQDGWKVAPYKAQNMSLNARVTRDGGEIGVAQYIQAVAAGAEPDVRMNPVLLKPQSDTGAALIVLGKPAGRADALAYGEQTRDLARIAFAAYDELAANAELMVMEGAGSPAEINLRQRDFVNMRAAIHAGARVLLAGDIDRGGVFASFIGHVATFRPDERRHLAGFLVNKFRGDARLLGDAYAQTLAYTGYPVVGTIPFINGLGIEDEDGSRNPAPRPLAPLQVAVIRLPHIANAQDFDPLAIEDDLNFEFVDTLTALGSRAWDAIIIPGSRASAADLGSLRQMGIADWIVGFAKSGKPVVGICGGLQILGRSIIDPLGVESREPVTPGLGLLDIETEFAADKLQKRGLAHDLASGAPIMGYQIRHGLSRLVPGGTKVAVTGEDGDALGFAKDAIWACYLHGLFESDEFRTHWVNGLRGRAGLPPRSALPWPGMEAELDRLAAIVRDSCDLPRIYGELGLA